MRSLILLLVCAFVVLCEKTAVKEDMYQIQGVEIDDSIEFEIDVSKHSAHARRKRQAAVDPTSLPRNKSESTVRRQAGYEAAAAAKVPSRTKPFHRALQVQQSTDAAVTAPLAANAHARTLRHFTSLAGPAGFQQQWLQQPVQFQQPAQFQQPQPLQRLPSNGFSPANSLQQQQALFAQLQQRQQGQQQVQPQLVQPFQPQPLPSLAPSRPAFDAPRTAVRTSKKGTNYYYPPRQPLPLPKCFHNPTGYVCCNEALNDLMVDTYTALEQRPKFHACNIQLIATHLQLNAQRHFNTSFETLVGYEDFAQKINFRGDMVCKVELGSRYMIAYATASDAYNHDLGGHKRDKREAGSEFEWSAGTVDSWHSIHSSFI